MSYLQLRDRCRKLYWQKFCSDSCKDSRKNNCEDSLPENRLAERVFEAGLLQVIPERILRRCSEKSCAKQRQKSRLFQLSWKAHAQVRANTQVKNHAKITVMILHTKSGFQSGFAISAHCKLLLSESWFYNSALFHRVYVGVKGNAPELLIRVAIDQKLAYKFPDFPIRLTEQRNFVAETSAHLYHGIRRGT